jgi:hypothetical protein
MVHLDQMLYQGAIHENIDQDEVTIYRARGSNAAPVPGDNIRCPPMAECFKTPDRWREIVRWKWRRTGHINVLEMQAALAAVQRRARSMKNWDLRFLAYVDSLVTLGVFSKGRSSRSGPLYAARRLGAVLIATGMRWFWRWVPTDQNHADAGSRGTPMGVKGTDSPQRIRTAPDILPAAFLNAPG